MAETPLEGSPVLVKTPERVDPSWTAQTTAEPIADIPAVIPESVGSAPPMQPVAYSSQVSEPTFVPARPPSHHQRATALWFVVPALVISLTILVGLLWWLGVFERLPADPQQALLLTVQELEKARPYHLRGKAELTIDPDSPSSTQPTQAARSFLEEWWARLALARAAAPPQADLIPSDDRGSEPLVIRLLFEADRVDRETGQSTISLDLSGLSGVDLPMLPKSVDIDTRQVGGQIYVRVPALSLLVGSQHNQWLSFASRDLLSLADREQQTVQWSEDGLRPLIASSQRLGSERLNGVRVTHYTYTVDPRAVIDWLGLGSVLDDAVFDPTQVSFVADLWVGQSDRLPQQFRVTLRSPDEGIAMSVLVEGQLSQFRERVTVQVPPPDEISSDGLLGAVQAFLGDGQGIDLEAFQQDARRKQDLAIIQTALELYTADRTGYPVTGAEIAKTNQPDSVLQELVTSGYLASLPRDPQDPTYYYGYRSLDGRDYELWSILANTADPAGINRDGYFLYVVRPTAAPAASPPPSDLPAVDPSPSPTGIRRG